MDTRWTCGAAMLAGWMVTACSGDDGSTGLGSGASASTSQSASATSAGPSSTSAGTGGEAGSSGTSGGGGRGGAGGGSGGGSSAVCEAACTKMEVDCAVGDVCGPGPKQIDCADPAFTDCDATCFLN